MSKQQLDVAYFKRSLLELRDELLSLDAAGKAAAQTVELDQSRVGRLSRMDALQGQAMSQASNRRRAENLQRVEAALRRVDRGNYGECQGCGEFINPKRLEFDPAARLCIACAGSKEA